MNSALDLLKTLSSVTYQDTMIGVIALVLFGVVNGFNHQIVLKNRKSKLASADIKNFLSFGHILKVLPVLIIPITSFYYIGFFIGFMIYLLVAWYATKPNPQFPTNPNSPKKNLKIKEEPQTEDKANVLNGHLINFYEQTMKYKNKEEKYLYNKQDNYINSFNLKYLNIKNMYFKIFTSPHVNKDINENKNKKEDRYIFLENLFVNTFNVLQNSFHIKNNILLPARVY